MENFPDNLSRVLGMHRLTAREGAELTGMSQAAFYAYLAGARRPGLTTALGLAEFFELPPQTFVTGSFEELLPRLADADRFRSVEAKLDRARKPLRVVEQEELVATVKQISKQTKSRKKVK